MITNVDALHELADFSYKVAFPRTANKAFDEYQFRLQQLVAENYGREAAETLTYDQKDGVFYVTVKIHSTPRYGHSGRYIPCMHVDLTYQLDPEACMVQRFRDLNEEIEEHKQFLARVEALIDADDLAKQIVS